MPIKAVLLDIDNTLLDFSQASRLVIQDGFAAWGLPYDEGVFATFTEINDGLWRDLEQGKLTREGLYQVRWALIFQALGIDADGPAFDVRFRQTLREYACPVEGALELVKYLAGRYCLAAASNATYAQQVKRLNDAGMLGYFRYLFISGEMGFSKPAPGFYDRCFDVLSPIRPQETIIIGDSLTADIAGGAAYGLKTCWYNHHGHPLTGEVKPDLEVRHLSEIHSIL